MARRARLDGLSNALRAVARIPGAMSEARSDTLHEWADDVEATAEDRVPVRTGDLKEKIEQQVSEQYGRAEVGVWDPDALEYAQHVEQGTSSMPDQPYLRPAFDQHRRQVPRIYRAAFRRHMGGAAE
ncbi:HK97-gp10 family putative phage morphogenesis protein [Streptomyces sp. NPDC091377]|uniref:HK97-gp10 family putative phage morphogenesis protein n=1 Tax=Streptomyces sp. NPDC091377 TaxID=3365995 RepID=UPI003816041A